jgi:exodeoxyribonuclease V alpha subunit
MSGMNESSGRAAGWMAGSDELPDASPLADHFARLMVKLNGAPCVELEAAAALLSRSQEAGHVCVPLARSDVAIAAEALRATRVVGGPGEFKPLILDDAGRLYLQRYWQYEQRVATGIRARLCGCGDVNLSLLEEGLVRFFGASAKKRHGQARAARTAVEKMFCVITGGPGTGKTRTALIVVALLAEQFAARGARLRIALTAPTGKAAARLHESLLRTAAAVPTGALAVALPALETRTLHRLLGALPESPYFRHDAARPLPIDAVIVDEASMIDLALFAKLVDALPAHARLILLGDKDQLASVQAGYVFGDICDEGSMAASARPARLEGHIVELTENFRFHERSGIGQLRRAINRGASEEALALLEAGDGVQIRSEPLPAIDRLPARIREVVLGTAGFAATACGETGDLFARAARLEAFREYLAARDPATALAQFNQFRILCAVRHGPFGVENINRLVENALAGEGLIDPAAGRFYAGRPVLIVRNDATLKLFNGDVGLILPDPDEGGELRAFFSDGQGGIRRVLPARLPPHETVFAMTAHKSQGSEFSRVLVILPDRPLPVVTRELIYTAATRAIDSLELWLRAEVFRDGLARKIERASGLRDLLWSAHGAAGAMP